MKALQYIGAALALIGVGVLISTAVGMHLGLMAVGLAALAVGALLAFIGREPDESEEEAQEKMMEEDRSEKGEDGKTQAVSVLRR